MPDTFRCASAGNIVGSGVRCRPAVDTYLLMGTIFDHAFIAGSKPDEEKNLESTVLHFP